MQSNFVKFECNNFESYLFDAGLVIEPPPDDVVSSQRAPNVGSSINSDMNIDPKASEADQLDVLKSFVYGGLGESITSLGIVTSAAATGVTTRKCSFMAYLLYYLCHLLLNKL